MDFDALYPNRFLKAGELAGKDVTLTISNVKLETLEGEKGDKKKKGIVSFRETPKELVLNRTNGESIKAMFGRETDNWIGKKVTIWPAQINDSFTGERIPAIRVRGSPDLGADKEFTAKIGRKIVTMKVQRTGTKAAKPAAPTPAPADPPPMSEEEKASILATELAEAAQ